MRHAKPIRFGDLEICIGVVQASKVPEQDRRRTSERRDTDTETVNLDPGTKAFLDTIAAATQFKLYEAAVEAERERDYSCGHEGCCYDLFECYRSRDAEFSEDYEHPRSKNSLNRSSRPEVSSETDSDSSSEDESAAGRYMITARYWENQVNEVIGATSFDPKSQYIGAVAILYYKRGRSGREDNQ